MAGGHAEKGEAIFRVSEMLQFGKSLPTESATTSGVGMVKLSGVKLYLSDGTDWNLISSA